MANPGWENEGDEPAGWVTDEEPLIPYTASPDELEDFERELYAKSKVKGVVSIIAGLGGFVLSTVVGIILLVVLPPSTGAIGDKLAVFACVSMDTVAIAMVVAGYRDYKNGARGLGQTGLLGGDSLREWQQRRLEAAMDALEDAADEKSELDA